ncbi:unnamed protein product, partial [Didymodactylos carnosus]
GKLTYEFVRMNLIAALPAIPTLNNLILNANLRVAEAEFRFDALQQHLLSIHTKLGFVSEDCTGVIRKIKYDVTTNSFVGFATPLANGVPIAQFYQTDSYEQLKSWFDTIDKAPLLNVHMFQPLPSNNTELVHQLHFSIMFFEFMGKVKNKNFKTNAAIMLRILIKKF